MKNWWLKSVVLLIAVSSSRWNCSCDESKIAPHPDEAESLKTPSRTKISQINHEHVSSVTKQTRTLHGFHKPHFSLTTPILPNNGLKRQLSLQLEAKPGIFIRTPKVLQEADVIQTISDNKPNVETFAPDKVPVKATSQQINTISNSEIEDIKHDIKPSAEVKIQSSDSFQRVNQLNEEDTPVSEQENDKKKHVERKEKTEESKDATKKEQKADSTPDATKQSEKQEDQVVMMEKMKDESLKIKEKPVLKEGAPKSEDADSEVMPSFDEWKKMMLAEQEKDGHKVQPLDSVSGKKIVSHKRRHNYASYECGAKIVAANTEAEGTNHILNEMVDEYMLNPCKAKIWFVIELCESIQILQIELANFELFSSSPKEFSISWSDRFPTREWTPLGVVTVEDQRALQSFSLEHRGYGKFIKFELLSHYGTEHYCPISVVRVFGTSMVDEYEEMETAGISHHLPDDDEDRLDISISEEASSSQDLFGSARDAVINIVKKAAQALTRDNQEVTESQTYTDILDNKSVQADCERYLNCTDALNVTKITVPLSFPLIPYSEYCEFCSLHIDKYQSHTGSTSKCHFLYILYGPLVFENFCQQHKMMHIMEQHRSEEPVISPTIVITETKTLVQKLEDTLSEKVTSESKNETIAHSTKSVIDSVVHSSSQSDKSLSSSDVPSSQSAQDLQKSIQPTKTVHSISQEAGVEPASKDTKTVEKPTDTQVMDKTKTLKTLSESSKDTATLDLPNLSEQEQNVQKLQPSIADSEIKIVNTQAIQDVTETLSVSVDTQSLVSSEPVSQQVSSTEVPVSVPETEIGTEEIEKEEKYENGEQGGIPSKVEPMFTGIPSPPGQKESVFMRMGNRIKALELNMSLSSQYLQELSQRYRRQMEDMQKAFNRTIGTLNDTAYKAAIKDLQQQEIIRLLQAQVANLTNSVDLLLHERQSTYRQMLETHLCLMVIEAIIMITILSLCVRRMSLTTTHPLTILPQSVCVPAVQYSSSPTRGRKRTATADNEPLGSHPNYLIVEPSTPVMIEPPPKVKKKHHKNKKKNQHLKPKKHQNGSCNINYFSSLENCDNNATESFEKPLQRSASMQSLKNNNCENTCSGSHNIQKQLNRDRIESVPLKNLTNGNICNGTAVHDLSPNKFSLKKFLKLQKKYSF